MMTLQEMFDEAGCHLIRQGEQSLVYDEIGASCAYRGFSGTKCAVGALIPDDKYNPRWEGRPVIFLRQEPGFWALFGDDVITMDFLSGLQVAHDTCCFPSDFRRHVFENLKDLSVKFNLSFDAVEQCVAAAETGEAR